jgi:hypothetical protein
MVEDRIICIQKKLGYLEDEPEIWEGITEGEKSEDAKEKFKAVKGELDDVVSIMRSLSSKL